jgi:hypothetical protein
LSRDVSVAASTRGVKMEKVIMLENLWGDEETLKCYLQSEDYRKVLVAVSLEAMLIEHL